MWKSYAIRMDNQDLWALEARIFLEFTINHLWQEVHRIQGFSWCTLWILLCPDQLLIWWLCEVSETFFLLRGIIKQRIHANHPLSFRSQCWSPEIKWLTNTMNSAQDFWFLSDPWEEWNIITEEVNQWCLSLNELTWFTLLFWWTLLWFFSYLFLKNSSFLEEDSSFWCVFPLPVFLFLFLVSDGCKKLIVFLFKSKFCFLAFRFSKCR